jgi:hypothetical protein
MNTKTNIHVRSGIQTHDPSNEAVKTYALEHSATGTEPISTLHEIQQGSYTTEDELDNFVIP